MDPDASRGHASRPFRLDRCGDLSPLRRALADAGYTEPAVARTVRVNPQGVPVAKELALRLTADETPVNTLVRLFMLAHPVREEAARTALAAVPLESLFALGLLERGPDGVRSVAALIPFQDQLQFLREFWPEFSGEPRRRDYVLGVGATSRHVALVTVRRPVDTALDLGTGTGFLAFLMARHAERVIATDTSPRALNFAEANARLNGVTNVELRRGSLYEPVEGQTFDLISSNPPFVVSPSDDYEYRDGGMEGDRLSQQVIRGAAQRLREGGFANVMFDWHHREPRDWAERPTRWLEDCGCDVWLIQSSCERPAAYAAKWLGGDHARDSERYRALLGQWAAYYERLGIGAISTGNVILRRRSGRPNWLRADRAPPEEVTSPCSDQIQRIFAAQDLLEDLDDDRALLDRAFALTSQHAMEQTLRCEDGRWVVQKSQIKQTSGFHFVGNIDRLVGTVLAGCDGTRTLRELVADLADGIHAEVERVAPPCAAVIRKLLETGFLTVG